MQSDEEFQPRCDICKNRYGKTDPYIDNVNAIEVYNLMNSDFIVNAGLEKEVLDNFSNGSKQKLIKKLISIYLVSKEFQEDKTPEVKKTENANPKRVSKRMKRLM